MIRFLACVARRMVACSLAVLSYTAVHAQSANFLRDCQEWIDKKGYSTDYIEQKIGKRQRGLASAWRGNVAVREVQPGDVVLIALSAPGAQHAALAEEVRKNSDGSVSAVRVSEWNWGRTTNERCLITENFGRLAPERWINLSSIAQVWRPSAPLRE